MEELGKRLENVAAAAIRRLDLPNRQRHLTVEGAESDFVA
jgi:hypothetical protein